MWQVRWFRESWRDWVDGIWELGGHLRVGFIAAVFCLEATAAEMPGFQRSGVNLECLPMNTG